MEIFYRKTQTEKLCTNFKNAQRKLGYKPAIGLKKAIGFIESATSFEAVMNYGPFHYHRLQGNLKDICSLDIDGRNSKWRLYVRPVNSDGESLITELADKKSEIIHILIMEVNDHG
ncbi:MULTISPECIES: hypothetical protein [Mammaliicoccus]|uniref:hypothetical protein n=1 Tax=Mammaliicoccus TaxID=2803850 RepID=UPI000DFB8C9D|nr:MULTISPECIES: hypothetical protein [Mammaliicoccus]RTX85294.1 hypothetical protein CD129_11195 [Mammaliicoccus fleurettii]SUM37840.1 Uncharacterised protein [Mammaliicoccus fleurettii]HCN60024.1 hypothetical protein [Staphylococcus sp.]